MHKNRSVLKFYILELKYHELYSKAQKNDNAQIKYKLCERIMFNFVVKISFTYNPNINDTAPLHRGFARYMKVSSHI